LVSYQMSTRVIVSMEVKTLVTAGQRVWYIMDTMTCHLAMYLLKRTVFHNQGFTLSVNPNNW